MVGEGFGFSVEITLKQCSFDTKMVLVVGDALIIISIEFSNQLTSPFFMPTYVYYGKDGGTITVYIYWKKSTIFFQDCVLNIFRTTERRDSIIYKKTTIIQTL